LEFKRIKEEGRELDMFELEGVDLERD